MTLSDPPLLTLLQHQQALEEAETAFANQKKWLKKREEMEKEIFLLQEEMQQDFYKKHQKQAFEFHFEQILEAKRKQLFQLKQKQNEIDQWLDQTEEITEENLTQQRMQVLNAIWEAYPERRTEQEEKLKKWNDLQLFATDSLKMSHLLDEIFYHFNIAIQTRKSIKGKGLLAYIFGVSPNFVIEQQFIKIQSLSVQALLLLKKISQLSLTNSIVIPLQDLGSWFEQLKEACGQSWSFRHLDILFSKTMPVLQQFQGWAKHQQSTLTLEIESLQEEIRDWMRDNV